MKILVFDTETSGVNPLVNVILQLSYQIVDTDSWITQKTVNHYFPWPEDKSRISPEAIKVNGLTEDVLLSRQLSDRKSAFEEFVSDKDKCDLLIAHNIEFDKKFIIAGCYEEGVKYAKSGWEKSYDTMKKTTNICQIPKNWGKGYKWPKLTELANCLYVDFSDISLHDSSDDVELTKRCFKKLVVMGFYQLPIETDFALKIKVNSPEDIEFIVIKNGEPISQLLLASIPKKSIDIAKKEIIKVWSEENETERNQIVNIYLQSTKTKTTKDFDEEIKAIYPNQYVRKEFTEPLPTKEQIINKLEKEAEQNVSSWKFWALEKLRKNYVEKHLNTQYQQELNEYNKRHSIHEEEENKAEVAFNEQSKRECNEYKNYLQGLIKGNKNLIDGELNNLVDKMNLPLPIKYSTEFDKNTVNLTLSLPSPSDMPQMEGIRLASGNYKIRHITDKDKKDDYSKYALGLSFYIASHVFNISPVIESVNIEGSTSLDNENSKVMKLYHISFTRNVFCSLDFNNMELSSILSKFSFSNNLSKETLSILFDKYTSL